MGGLLRLRRPQDHLILFTSFALLQEPVAGPVRVVTAMRSKFLDDLRDLPVLAGDKPVGTMGSSADGKALALIRTDRAIDALDAGTPLTSGGLAIRIADPEGLRTAPKQTVA